MGSLSRALAAGVVSAMSMSGLRNVTVNLGLLDEVPPREILSDQAPRLVTLLAEDHEKAFAELAHWGYGATCGLAYEIGVARRRPERSRAWGPAYGLATLLLYRAVIAPALGIRTSRGSAITDQLMLAADHVLFGFVLDELIRASEADPR